MSQPEWLKKRISLKNHLKKSRKMRKGLIWRNLLKQLRVKFLIPIAVVALLIIAGIIAYPKIFKRNTLEKIESIR